MSILEKSIDLPKLFESTLKSMMQSQQEDRGYRNERMRRSEYHGAKSMMNQFEFVIVPVRNGEVIKREKRNVCIGGILLDLNGTVAFIILFVILLRILNTLKKINASVETLKNEITNKKE